MAERMGSCRTCKYSPVVLEARRCPNCGVGNPNPAAHTRYSNRFVPIGMVLGGLAGGGWYYFGLNLNLPMAMFGMLLGVFFSLPVSLIAAALCGIIAWAYKLLFAHSSETSQAVLDR